MPSVASVYTLCLLLSAVALDSTQEKVRQHLADSDCPADDSALQLLQVNKDPHMRAVRLHQNNASLQAAKPVYAWPMKDGPLTRNSYSDQAVLTNLDTTPTWSFVEPFNGIVRSGGLVDDVGDVYINSIRTTGPIGANVYRFEGTTGKQKWVAPFPLQIPASPALYDGSIYVVTNDTVLHRLSLDNGTEVFASVPTGDCIAGDTASLLVGEGVVVFAVSQKSFPGSQSGTTTLNNVVVALDAETGNIMWTYVPEMPTYNFIVSLANGRLIFADAIGTVYALEKQTGQLLWKTPQADPAAAEQAQFTTGGAVQSPDGSAAFTNGIVKLYNGSRVGRLAAYETTGGKLLWKTDYPMEANIAPSVGFINNTLVVVFSLGKNDPLPLPDSLKTLLPAVVAAARASDGALIWYYWLPIWYGAAAGDSLPEGHICWPDQSSTATIGGDGTVYIGHEDGKLYAIKDANGDGAIQPSEVSSYPTGNAFQGSVGIGPGTLVATPCNGVDVWITK